VYSCATAPRAASTGVPEMTPVRASSDRPSGSAGLTAKRKGASPLRRGTSRGIAWPSVTARAPPAAACDAGTRYSRLPGGKLHAGKGGSCAQRPRLRTRGSARARPAGRAGGAGRDRLGKAPGKARRATAECASPAQSAQP